MNKEAGSMNKMAAGANKDTGTSAETVKNDRNHMVLFHSLEFKF